METGSSFRLLPLRNLFDAFRRHALTRFPEVIFHVYATHCTHLYHSRSCSRLTGVSFIPDITERENTFTRKVMANDAIHPAHGVRLVMNPLNVEKL